jgi:toxin ParE1/3/4
MPVRGLRVTRAARRDLEGIRRHTEREWGQQRWLRYLDALEEAFQRVREEPASGRRRDNLGEGLRSVLTGSHVISYYETKRRELVVLRVLHQRQNAEALRWSKMIRN